MEADQCILLESEFTVEANADFEAAIQTCQ